MNPREALSLVHPRAVMIQTTSRCNANCVMCPHPLVRRTMPQGDMDEGLFAALIDEIAAFPGLRRVMLYLMNEPLLDRQIVARIRRARAALPAVELYLLSNGIALDDRLSDELLDAGLTWIGFSLHAARPETYRRITGRDDFTRVRDQVARHLRKMIDRYGPDAAMINATRIRPFVDDEEWDEIGRFWRDVGLQRLDLVEGYISRAGNVEVYGREPMRHAAMLGCKTVWAYEMAHVLFDGVVVPCCMDYRRRAVWGNARAQGLLAVWRGEARRRFLERMDGRELAADDLCRACEDAIPAAPPDKKPAETARERSRPERIPDILLVHPPPWLTAGPPLGLAALRAWVERDGFVADVVDVNIDLYHAVEPARRGLWEWEEGRVWENAAEVERLFGDQLRAAAAELAAHPAPVIGFSLASRKEQAAAILARETARLAPEKLLIAGGPATADPASRELVARLSGGALSVFAIGEGERTLSALLACRRHGVPFDSLPGLAIHRDGRVVCHEPPEPVDAAELPPPDYRPFDLSRYAAPVLFVEWSRGCTGGCAFCNVRRYWRRYRAKPAANVLAELETLRERHNLSHFSLVDPILNGQPARLEEIADGILARDWRLRWSGGISPNHPLTPAQFAKLAAAGCYRLEIGVESGSDRVLAAMKKRYTAAQAAEQVRAAHDAGLDVALYLIAGFPGEAEDDFAQTLELVESLAPAVTLVRSVNSLLLIPGAELAEEPEAFGIAAPDREIHGWERLWRAGDLTADERERRVARLEARLRELGVPVEFSNRADLSTDSRRHTERMARLATRLTDLDRRWDEWDQKAGALLVATGEQNAAGDLALAICPVWGPDMPPYGLASLAANVAQAGFATAVFDFNVDIYRRARPDLQRFWEEDSFRHWTDLADWQRLEPHLETAIRETADRLLLTAAPVIGFSVYSPNRRFTIEVCRRIKRLDPARLIVVGGRGIQSVAERLLFPPETVDYFLLGEGETALAELLRVRRDGGDLRELPFVDFFVERHLRGHAEPARVAEPGALADPDYSRFDLSAYRTADLPLLASRGCIGHCAFCNDHPAMGPYRARPGRQVAEEIARHRRALGVRRFRFNDQLINGDPAQLEAMCDALIAADTDVEWIALAAPRGDMSDDLLRKLKRAGCYTLNLGVESGSDAVLKKMAKGYRVADIEKALAQIRAAGINTMLNFIVGFPGESEADFEQTLELVRRNRASICGVNSINTCLVLLGSPLEKARDKLGLTVPDGAAADTDWRLGDNTPESRAARARRLIALLAELAIPVRVSNLHEKQADVARLAAPTPAGGDAAPAAPTADDPRRTRERRGTPRFEPLEMRPVDALLVMAPVWGVDVPPLGIAYLQSDWRAQGVTSQCLDLNVKLYNRAPDPRLWRMEAYKHWTEPELFAATWASLADLVDHYVAQLTAHPARVLGFSVNTGNFSFTRALTRRLKAARPERPIVLGGPGITNSFDIATLTPDEADYLVLGEGERIGAELVRALLAGGNPPGGAVRRVGEPIDFADLPRAMIADLDRLSWPRLEDFDLDEYATDGVPVLGSRGCIRHCTFCNDHHILQKYRVRSPEGLAAEIFWHADRGRLHFSFHDVLINGDVRRLARFCELLIADGREFQWGGQGVIRREMTPELFALLARAGCRSFVFGVESFSDPVLRLMNKPYTHEDARAVLAACHEAGIETIINLIVGFPGEGEAEFRETYDFVRDHFGIIDQVASISPCLINLGSRLFEKYRDYGVRFPESEGSIKWFTDDGNTFAERRRRVLALTTLLARREQDVHTVNLYDEPRELLPEVEVDAAATRVDAEPVDLLLVLPPPWGVDLPPLGLALLAAAAREAGQRVRVRDLNIEWFEAGGDYLRGYWDLEALKFWSPAGRLNEIEAFFTPQIEAFLAAIDRLKPRVVGFSTNESNLSLAARLARRVKEARPETTTLLGGPGVFWPADRARLGPAADYCLIGEAEISLPRFLAALNGGDVAATPGIVVCQNGEWREGPPPERPERLDDLPLPDFAALPLHLYRTNQFPLLFGRGCVNRCNFCNDHRLTPGYRALSPERLLAQVRELKARFGAFAFSFNDLLVNADLPALRRFCELVIAANERLAWTGQCLARPDMTADDYRLLRRAGCVSLVFGIESFSDDILRRMGKRFDASQAASALRDAKSAGLEVLINLIVGFPGETEETFAATCRFVTENRALIDRVSALSTCIVVAQSQLERAPEAFGIVLPKPEHWNQWYAADGGNDYAIRVDRLQRLARVLADAGIPCAMSNLYFEALEK
ncbi:MAG: radical SAM protein [Myxococcales bacterium]|nr:radical SAM protein [Myxococcales bacterium]